MIFPKKLKDKLIYIYFEKTYDAHLINKNVNRTMFDRFSQIHYQGNYTIKINIYSFFQNFSLINLLIYNTKDSKRSEIFLIYS